MLENMTTIDEFRAKLERVFNKHVKSQPSLLEYFFYIFNPAENYSTIYENNKNGRDNQITGEIRKHLRSLGYNDSIVTDTLEHGEKLLSDLLDKPNVVLNGRILEIFDGIEFSENMHNEALSRINRIFYEESWAKFLLDVRIKAFNELNLDDDHCKDLVDTLRQFRNSPVNRVYTLVNSFQTANILQAIGLMGYHTGSSKTGKSFYNYSAILPRLDKISYHDKTIIETMIEIIEGKDSFQGENSITQIRINEIISDLKSWERRDISFNKISALNNWINEELDISTFIWKYRHKFNYLNTFNLIEFPLEEETFQLNGGIRKSWHYHHIYRNFANYSIISIATYIVTQNINIKNIILLGTILLLSILKYLENRN